LSNKIFDIKNIERSCFFDYMLNLIVAMQVKKSILHHQHTLLL